MTAGQWLGLSERRTSAEEVVVAVGVFAGVPVRDYTAAVSWYELLLGTAPSF